MYQFQRQFVDNDLYLHVFYRVHLFKFSNPTNFKQIKITFEKLSDHGQ